MNHEEAAERTTLWYRERASYVIDVTGFRKAKPPRFCVGVTLFDAKGVGVRATSISRHEDEASAVRAAEHLDEIINFIVKESSYV